MPASNSRSDPPPWPRAEPDALAVLTDLPVGVLVADAGGRVRWANPAAAELLGLEAPAVAGLDLQTLPARHRLRLTRGAEKIRVRSRSGQVRWLECLSVRSHGDALIACVSDVSAYEERQRLVSRAPDRAPEQLDPVTGLLTRAAIVRHLDAQVARTRRYRNPLSVLVLRLRPWSGTGAVTPFDRHRPVREIGRLLREKLRWVDTAGVWGPHEFLLVLPETALEAACHLARKLRTQVRVLDKAEPGLFAGRTVAMACAEWLRHDDPHALLARVMRELEQAAPG